MRRRLAVLVALTLSLAGVAPAYYHFLHFSSRSAPFRGIPEKFDLNSLPNKTLTWFIGDMSNVQLASGDSTTALLSELRSAIDVWNNVESSDLRVAFGGSATPGLTNATPSVDVVFDETPGLVAMGGPTVWDSANGQFVPILKSVVIVNPNLSARPSHGDRIYTSFVHEFGHALGLQHTFTSGVMSTRYTRATSKGRPLSADDIAAVSLLYPRPSFSQNSGTISGRVTMSGQGVNLASVVAIAPNGAAVSALTNPDGTYDIDGLPRGNYYVYVHPLPPALEGEPSPGDILYPVDRDKRTFSVGSPFETAFYSAGSSGGVKDPLLASLVPANPGVSSANINFSVRQRTGHGIHSVETYAFPSGNAVRPPYISPGLTYPFVVATGYNMFTGSGPVAGLKASVIGGGDMAVRPYEQAPASYIQLDIDPRTLFVASNSPRHIVFSTPNDIYVLPSAFYHVERLPPLITGVVAGAQDGSTRTAVVTGTNLQYDSQILFDGMLAPARSFEDLGGGNGRLTVALPTAPAGYRSVVTAWNPDGQGSLSVQGDAPPVFTFSGDTSPAVPPAVVSYPSTVAPGTETVVQIDGVSTQWVEGQVSVAFGTSDVVVRRVSVVSPTRLVVNVVVAGRAQPANLTLTIVNGLQMSTFPYALAISRASSF